MNLIKILISYLLCNWNLDIQNLLNLFALRYTIIQIRLTLVELFTIPLMELRYLIHEYEMCMNTISFVYLRCVVHILICILVGCSKLFPNKYLTSEQSTF